MPAFYPLLLLWCFTRCFSSVWPITKDHLAMSSFGCFQYFRTHNDSFMNPKPQIRCDAANRWWDDNFLLMNGLLILIYLLQKLITQKQSISTATFQSQMRSCDTSLIVSLISLLSKSTLSSSPTLSTLHLAPRGGVTCGTPEAGEKKFARRSEGTKRKGSADLFSLLKRARWFRKVETATVKELIRISLTTRPRNDAVTSTPGKLQRCGRRKLIF